MSALRLPGDASDADRELMDRVAEALADQLNPLTGPERGKVVGFRLYTVVAGGNGIFLPMTLCATCDDLTAEQPALDQMLDHAEEVRRTQPPVGFFHREDVGRN